jgi:5'-3' exonuclease
MGRTWLVIDCPYIAWRNFHTLGELSWQDVPTGVVFGFFRDLLTFQQDYDTDHVVLCFDADTNLREQKLPRLQGD